MNQNTLRLGVLPNREKDPDLNVTRMLLAILRENGAAVVLEEEIAARLGAMELASQAENLFTQCDMAIAIGGDGTMLQVARGASASGVPVLGINLGHMGFLQEVEVGEMREAMNALCRGDYRIESRMMLSARIDGRAPDPIYAINDISIAKGTKSRLIYVDAYVGGQPIGEFAADGVIVATPTGSTAYSLSAGGPVVCPEMDCILFTPICPHTLHTRPVVMAAEETIRLQVWDRDSDVVLTVDGQVPMPLHAGEWVTLKRGPYCVQFVRLKPRNFFGVLHKKFLE